MSKTYADRYPDAGRTNAWHGEMVHIETNMGLWNPGGCGYTGVSTDAWLVPFEFAVDQVRHLGPEKQPHFVLPDGHPGIHTADYVSTRKAAPEIAIAAPEPETEDQPGF
jgi:hypothetical protein